jgi:peptide/nickel transport system ATP-binding protein
VNRPRVELAKARTEAPAVPVAEVEDLHVEFRLRRGPLAGSVPLRAVRAVDLEIGERETVGLVGESGSGKSTTGRAMLRLVEPVRGRIRLDGQDITDLRGEALRGVRRKMQMVFQDPYSSLDPAMVVAESIAEPLDTHLQLGRAERSARVGELMEHVGLSRQHLNRYPYEFSGGQRQRIAIARAVAVHPRLVVCDEAVSALDVSTQNQILNLLEDIQAESGISYLFIAHDLAVVRHIAHRVAVMYLGEIVETGPTDRLFDRPAHPYTEALLSAVPLPSPRRQRERERIVLTGEVPDAADPPAGCTFHTRCPYVMDVCRVEVPATTPVPGGGTVRCHLRG